MLSTKRALILCAAYIRSFLPYKYPKPSHKPNSSFNFQNYLKTYEFRILEYQTLCEHQWKNYSLSISITWCYALESKGINGISRDVGLPLKFLYLTCSYCKADNLCRAHPTILDECICKWGWWWIEYQMHSPWQDDCQHWIHHQSLFTSQWCIRYIVYSLWYAV